MSARIIIIGAGAAGIAAGTRLVKHGFENILVVEAEGRIGGRINTIPFGKNVVDMGAQWCHGEKDNAVFGLVQNLDILDSTDDRNVVCIKSNGEQVPKEICDKLTCAIGECLESADQFLVGYKGSFGKYLKDKYEEVLRKPDYSHIDTKTSSQFFEFYKKFKSSVEACDLLEEVSGEGYLHYWDCEGDQLLNWKDKGYSSFLSVLMSDFPGSHQNHFNTKICLKKKIELIIWDRHNTTPIVVKCVDGDVFEADHIICTLSLGVLKDQHLKLFSPQLPLWKIRSLEGLSIGTVDKIFLEFAEPFWPENWPGLNLLWEDDDLEEIHDDHNNWLADVFGFYVVDYQPNILCGWISGASARRMETLKEQDVRDGAVFLLRKFLPWEIPIPIDIRRSIWYSNPNFRGSYSFRSVHTDRLQTSASELASPLISKINNIPIVLFAGEATHDHYYSTVHGAVETGWREAQRIIDTYSKKKSHL